jgi:hypothetical protein
MWHTHDGEDWPEHAHPEDIVEFERNDGSNGTERVVYLWDREEWPDVARYRIVVT